MNCLEKMDAASAKLSRARTALSLAMKAGTEATKGELLDVIIAAIEHIDSADAMLTGEVERPVKPGLCTPAVVDGQRRLVAASNAS